LVCICIQPCHYHGKIRSRSCLLAVLSSRGGSVLGRYASATCQHPSFSDPPACRLPETRFRPFRSRKPKQSKTKLVSRGL
jgi:hypothetical protein